MASKSTPEKRIAFLAALAATCNVTKAAEAAGLDRTTLYLWRDADAAFKSEWERALTVGAEALEDEAKRRAFDGVDKPVFYQGIATETVREYSDTLAIFLLKGAMPDKYRENSKVEMSGSLNLSSMSDEEMRQELAALAASGVIVPPDDISDLV